VLEVVGGELQKLHAQQRAVDRQQVEAGSLPQVGVGVQLLLQRKAADRPQAEVEEQPRQDQDEHKKKGR